MSDVFKEQLVKRKGTSQDILKLVGIAFGGLILIVSVNILPFIPYIFKLLFTVAATLFFVFIFVPKLNIEYEYILTNDELDIDIIYSRSKRKHVFSANLREIEIMARVQNKENNQKLSNYNIIKDFSSGTLKENTFAFIINKNGKKTKVIFEPNDVIIQAISMYLTPRILHKQ